MTEITKLEGSILVSKATVLNLLRMCLARQLNKDATLFEAGMEQQKALFAKALQKEFRLDLNLNPAEQLIKELSR